MRLLRLAVENQRWDLAAHTIVLATARLLNNVAPDERKHIVEVLEQIRSDPLVDGITKYYFLAAPAVFTLYKEADWWIIYYIPRENVLHIINIGRVTESVNIRRAS